MKVHTSFSLVAVAFATLTLSEPVVVTWGRILNTGEQALVVAVNRTQVVASSCEPNLTLGSTHVQVTADSKAIGVLKIGNNTYDLEDENICDGSWSPKFVQISCKVPWDGLINVSSFFSATESTIKCFSSKEQQETLFEFGVEETLGEEPQFYDPVAQSLDVEVPSDGSIDKRQNNCGINRIRIDRRNPNYPKKWRRHVQLTPNVNCGDGDCSTGFERSWSVTHEASFSLAGSGWADWAGAGYSVSFSRGNAFAITCNAGPHQRVCVKNWRRYQQYDVLKTIENNCLPTRYIDYAISSPMTGDWHQEFWCGRGNNHCRNQGYVYWEFRGDGIVT